MVMTPKEKAQELIDKFSQVDTPNWDPISGTIEQEQIGFYSGKECALIAVDEIFEFMKMDDEYTETLSNANSIWVNYWVEVKKEIEKL